MTIAQRQKEAAELALAAALGRPERRCPACNELGAHWVPDGLADPIGADGLGEYRDVVVPGYFTCTPTLATPEETTPSLLDELDLGDGPRASGWYGGDAA